MTSPLQSLFALTSSFGAQEEGSSGVARSGVALHNARFCSGRSHKERAQRASENARLQQASLGRRHVYVASKQPIAQRNGDGPQPSRPYARRSPFPERACPTRRRRRMASTSPDARRRRRCFGWCRIICTACRRSTTTASRASAATRARTSLCSRSRVNAATSVRAVMPFGWQSGRSGWTRHCSRRASPAGRSHHPQAAPGRLSVPAAACSARSSASPPAP